MLPKKLPVQLFTEVEDAVGLALGNRVPQLFVAQCSPIVFELVPLLVR